MTSALRSTGRSGGCRRVGRQAGLAATVIMVGILGAACGSEESSSTGETDGTVTSTQPEAQQEEGSTMPEPAAAATIEGTVTVDGLDEPVTVSGLSVRLQDVSKADASAQTVAEATMDRTEFSPGDQVRFSVAVPDGLDPSASHILSAHADLDSSGDISVGDYITMESYPVTVDGSQGPVGLVLRLVSS